MKPVTQCRYAQRYKAKRKPSCGCFVCDTKWRLAELERQNQQLLVALDLAIDKSKYAIACADGALYVANLGR